MSFFTHSRLMRESTSSVVHHASFGSESVQRMCVSVLDELDRYRSWQSLHDRLMWRVVRSGEREEQIRELRLIAIELLARAARVRDSRDDHNRVALSKLCVTDLLQLVFDRNGLSVIRSFEQAYMVLSEARCDWILTSDEDQREDSRLRLLEATNRVAELRRHLLDGVAIPPVRVLLPKPVAQSPVTEHPFDRNTRIAL